MCESCTVPSLVFTGNWQCGLAKMRYFDLISWNPVQCLTRHCSVKEPLLQLTTRHPVLSLLKHLSTAWRPETTSAGGANGERVPMAIFAFHAQTLAKIVNLLTEEKARLEAGDLVP